MIELLKKKKHIQALLKIRQGQLDLESLTLSQIKKSLREEELNLKHFQEKYFESIESLNQARLDQNIWQEQLDSSGTYFFKNSWSHTMKKTKELQKEVDIQLEKVAKAQNSLKAAESLEEKIILSLKQEIERKEQSFLEDVLRRGSS